MGTLYIVIDNDGNQRRIESNDVITLARHLQAKVNDVLSLGHGDASETESQFRISFDINTGHVELFSTDPAGVKNIYQNSSFDRFTQPLREAICLIAKLRLLELLPQLQDNALASVLIDTGVNKQTGEINMTKLNTTFLQLQFKVKPLKPKTFLFSFSNHANQSSSLRDAVAMFLMQCNGQPASLNQVNDMVKRLRESQQSETATNQSEVKSKSARS